MQPAAPCGILHDNSCVQGGKAAAEAAISMQATGDFSAASTRQYERRWNYLYGYDFGKVHTGCCCCCLLSLNYTTASKGPPGEVMTVSGMRVKHSQCIAPTVSATKPVLKSLNKGCLLCSHELELRLYTSTPSYLMHVLTRCNERETA